MPGTNPPLKYTADAQSKVNQTVNRIIQDKWVQKATKIVGKATEGVEAIESKDPRKVISVLYGLPDVGKPTVFGRVPRGPARTVAIGLSKRLRDKVPLEYQVYVLAIDLQSGEKLVECYGILQEEVNLATETNWQPWMPSRFQAEAYQQTIAQQFGWSLINRWTTRRVWMGTDPLIMRLKLRFEADENARDEVVQPCIGLKKLASPREGPRIKGKSLKIPVLYPPGPNPVLRGGVAGWGAGEKVSIQIGLGMKSFLYFDSVIIKRVEVTYANRFGPDGYPISATANIDFQSYQVLTKKDIDSIYAGKTVEVKENKQGG